MYSLIKDYGPLKRRLCLLFLIIICVSSLMFTYLSQQREHLKDLTKQKEQNQKKLFHLKKVSEDLNVEIELLQTDEYLGQLARRNYYFSKDGEIILILPKEK